MAIFSVKERAMARDIGRLGFTNPFLEERIELEKQVLGDAFVPMQRYWNATESMDDNANVALITRRAHQLLHKARGRLAEGKAFAGDAEKRIYFELVLFALYYVCQDSFYHYIRSGGAVHLKYEAFREQADFYLLKRESDLFDDVDVAHLYALFFVIRRAFHYIFRYIFGGSRAVARLRAAVWESIFTSCMERYHRSMYQRMDRISTLVLGPTGTGKDLVSRAIGYARYIPYSVQQRDFAAPFKDNYCPLNLNALSPTLVEAELFGYVRGAFTGAQKDTEGFLDRGGPFSTLFLDEVGDVVPEVQVKLLRVLQSGEYTPVGTRDSRFFAGKIVAATNLDLAQRMANGRFREDLYFRLCSDVVTTPSLAEQIADEPDELLTVVRRLAANVAGEGEGERLADEVMCFIQQQMPSGYQWPGNIRELEQCVSNVLVRGRYEPVERMTDVGSGAGQWQTIFDTGSMRADELLAAYCTAVYATTGSYVETARRLDLDRRTVKAHVDAERLKAMGNGITT